MTTKNAQSTHSFRTLALADVFRAALLVLTMALVGLCLFVLAVLGVLGLGERAIDPSALEPGLGLSNQALTIAFALAGALASTIVAYAALRAQTSANEAQNRSLAMAEKSRVYAEVRRDLLRHAAVISAFHTVFSRAHEITEDLLRSLPDHLAQIQAQPSSGPDQKSDPDQKVVVRYELPFRDGDHVASITAAHHTFWNAIAAAQKTERPDLALDQLWLARHSSENTPSRLVNLSRAMGFFGLKRPEDALAADFLAPSTLAARGTPMTFAVAQDILRLVRNSVQNLAQAELSMSLARANAEPTKFKRQMAKAQMNLDQLAASALKLPQNAAALLSDSERLREAFEAIREASENLSNDSPPEALTEQYKTLRDLVDHMAQDTDQLMALLPTARQGAISAAAITDFFEELIDDAFEELSTLGFELKETVQLVAPQSHARLILARHGAGPSGDAVAALSAFVAGAIVLPDGALLCAGQPHIVVKAEWKANLGLALFEDLSRLYIDRAADPNGALDLARMISDDRALGGDVFDTAYGQDRAAQIGALPAAFDALWLMLKADPETLTLLTVQDTEMFEMGRFNFAGALQRAAEEGMNANDLLEGRESVELVLTLDPALARKPRPETAKSLQIESPESANPDDEIPS